MKKFLLALGICGIIVGGCVNDPTLSDEVGFGTDSSTDTATELLDEDVVDAILDYAEDTSSGTDTETSTVVE